MTDALRTLAQFELLEPRRLLCAAHPAVERAALCTLEQLHSGDLAQHIHPRLTLIVNGANQQIPAGIGISRDGRAQTIHTHTSDGVIHVESFDPRPYQLKEFFRAWGKPLDGKAVGDWTLSAGGRIAVTVNGRASSKLGGLVLRDNDEIVLRVDGAVPTPRAGEGEELPPKISVTYNGQPVTDQSSGYELYKTDGTAAGTVRVADIFAGNGSSMPDGIITTPAGRVYFTADDGVHGRELWTSDGTPAGTRMVKDLSFATNTDFAAAGLTAVGETVFFWARTSNNGTGLFKTDGTSAGTTLVRTMSFGFEPIAFSGKLFFRFNDGTSGSELWSSDGTTAGTALVADIRNGANSSSPQNFTLFNNALYFAATDTAGDRELWRSDGTTAGTTQAVNINATLSASPRQLRAAGPQLFFIANTSAQSNQVDDRIWVTDGMAGGTIRLTNDSNSGFEPDYLTIAGSTAYFVYYTQATGRELWKSDGTVVGTGIVKDIQSVDGLMEPHRLAAAGDRLFFVANDAVNGPELWTSDGTSFGTTMARDIAAGVDFESNVRNLTALGNRVVFSAFDEANGTELWASDGTFAGTALVRDLAPGSLINSYPSQFARSGSAIFFRARDGDQQPVDLGTRLQTSPSADHSFTIYNSGGALLRVHSVSVPDGYTVTTPLPLLVNAGSSGTFTIRSSSTKQGNHAGVVRVHSNAETAAAYEFAITGFVQCVIDPSDPSQGRVSILLDSFTDFSTGQTRGTRDMCIGHLGVYDADGNRIGSNQGMLETKWGTSEIYDLREAGGGLNFPNIPELTSSTNDFRVNFRGTGPTDRRASLMQSAQAHFMWWVDYHRTNLLTDEFIDSLALPAQSVRNLKHLQYRPDLISVPAPRLGKPLFQAGEIDSPSGLFYRPVENEYYMPSRTRADRFVAGSSLMPRALPLDAELVVDDYVGLISQYIIGFAQLWPGQFSNTGWTTNILASLSDGLSTWTEHVVLQRSEVTRYGYQYGRTFNEPYPFLGLAALGQTPCDEPGLARCDKGVNLRNVMMFDEQNISADGVYPFSRPTGTANGNPSQEGMASQFIATLLYDIAHEAGLGVYKTDQLIWKTISLIDNPNTFRMRDFGAKLQQAARMLWPTPGNPSRSLYEDDLIDVLTSRGISMNGVADFRTNLPPPVGPTAGGFTFASSHPNPQPNASDYGSATNFRDTFVGPVGATSMAIQFYRHSKYGPCDTIRFTDGTFDATAPYRYNDDGTFLHEMTDRELGNKVLVMPGNRVSYSVRRGRCQNEAEGTYHEDVRPFGFRVIKATANGFSYRVTPIAETATHKTYRVNVVDPSLRTLGPATYAWTITDYDGAATNLSGYGVEFTVAKDQPFSIKIDRTRGATVDTLEMRERGTDFDRYDGQAFVRNFVNNAPLAGDGMFAFETGQAASLAFTEDVSGTLARTDLDLTNLTTGAMFTPGAVAFDYATRRASFTFAGTVPDGNYRGILPAGSVAEPGGAPLANAATVEFFVFAGDANRDRMINITDFSILAQRFNQPGTFTQGDFNYSGQVEIGDFSILASKFNTSLPALPALSEAEGSEAERPAPRGTASNHPQALLLGESPQRRGFFSGDRLIELFDEETVEEL